MPRVVHLRSSRNFWGVERQLLGVVAPLRDLGFESHFLMLYRRHAGDPSIHPFADFLADWDFDVRTIPDPHRFAPGVVRQVAAEVRAGSFDLLHTHDYRSDLIGFLVAHRLSIPMVCTVHGYSDSTMSLRIYKWIDLVILRLTDRVIAVSGHLRDQLLSVGLRPDRVTVARNAIDVAGFTLDALPRGQIRRELGLADGPLVTVVGRLSGEKGHYDLLRAGVLVKAAEPTVRFLIVGDGPLRNQLETMATEVGLADSVIFTGYRSDVASCLAASDLFVLPSLREGIPSVLLEAMSIGLPVICTRVGGVPEVVTDGETGMLVAPSSPTQLAEAILYLLYDPARAQQMGVKGRDRVVAEFAPARVVAQWAEIYRAVTR